MAKNIKVTLTLDDSQYKRKLKSADKDLKQIGGTNSTLMAGFGKLGPAIAAAFSIGAIVEFGRKIREASIEMENIRNQLTLVASSADDLDRIMALLTQTAVNNRTSFAATAELFTKLKVATDELGRSEEEVVIVTSKLSQALQVAGADAATTNSVVRQFGQAMASGTVRGDEFNSLVEGLGPALAIMAKETGIGVGELREMSQAGELTADVLFDMIKNSNALSASFAGMNKTTEQLETALGDAFNRFLVKIGEASGITERYKLIVKGLTRELDIMSGAEGAIANMSLDEIMEKSASGAITLEAALEELNARFDDAGPNSYAVGLTTYQIMASHAANAIRELTGAYDEERNALTPLITETEALIEAQEKQKKENDKAKAAAEAHDKVLKGIIATVAEQIELGKQFAKGEYRTELEIINDRVTTAKNTMDALRVAFLKYHEAQGGGIATLEDYEAFLKQQGFTLDDLINEYAAAKQAQQEFTDAQNEGKDALKGYDKFMAELLEDMLDFEEQQGFVKTGLEEINKALASGTLTLEQYTFLQDALNKLLEDGLTPLEQYRELLEGITESLEEVDTFEEFTALQERLNELYKTGKIELEDYIRLLNDLKDAYTTAEEGAALVISAIEDLSRGLSDDLADAIMNGESLMDGMKDTFKKVITQMIADAFRLKIIEPILSGIFGGSFSGGSYTPGSGGIFSSIVGGIFGKAAGGPVSKNRPYLVGERGPELFVPNSSGNITPNMAMGGEVTYHINAVDARSFKELVASDPEYLYNVTQVGARRQPR